MPRVDKFKFGENHYDDAGNLHREDGPAVLAGAIRIWYRHGAMHNTNGPAITGHINGLKWIVNGKDVTNKIKDWSADNNINIVEPTEEEKVLISIFLSTY